MFFCLHVLPGNAEALVRRGGAINHNIIVDCLLTVIFLLKICQNWLMFVVVIKQAKYVWFLRHSVSVVVVVVVSK